MIEEWRKIIWGEDYFISNLGRVMSVKFNKNKIMKTNIDPKGYERITFMVNGKIKSSKIHQLVAESFLGHTRCGSDIVVDHIDGIKTNNKLSNLQLLSNRKNVLKYFNKSDSDFGIKKLKSGMYQCGLYQKGKKINLGFYKHKDEAEKIISIAVSNIDLLKGDKRVFKEIVLFLYLNSKYKYLLK